MMSAGKGWRTIGNAVLVMIALAAVIQAIPYGRDHANPPRLQEPAWDSPRTRELFFRACGDCHSNETRWPWYGSIAPFSWLVQYDVARGRSHFNVSEWGRRKNKGDEAAEEFRSGEMPPFFYLPLHREARFTEAERQEFIQGLIRTFGDKEGKK
jgi:mono/diheme cytochrome c family protein